MRKVLVVVDLQNDFVDMALGTKEAVEIVPNVVKEIESGEYDTIYATMDTHQKDYLNTLEGHYLPVEHCIEGEQGWFLEPNVQNALIKHHAEIVEKPTFGSLSLMEKMKENNPDEIVICGLCTDICVINNALLLRAALPNTKITALKNACAGTTPQKHEASLSVMESCQIEVK